MAVMFHLLPDRTGDAAENMALDFLLLQRYPEPDALRLRHYDWRRPAATFGYSQKIAFVRAQLADPDLDISRRATGGGIVDHTEDWTFCLVIPRRHELWAESGPQVYKRIHESMTQALIKLGARVRLQTETPDTPAGICFTRAEVNDVVSRLDDIEVVLDDNDGVSLVHKLVQDLQQPTGVLEVQSRRWLVENIQCLAGTPPGKLPGQLHALRLAAA